MANSMPISEDDLPALNHLAAMLHLFHHRNNNQHRRSIWYRHFSIFRKQLNHVTADLTEFYSIPTATTTNVAKTRKKATDAKLITRTEARLVFWRDVLVAKWRSAFSQLIADSRFSVLGVVLMAVLAEACRVTGVMAELEEMRQGEVETVLEQFEREEWGDGRGGEGEEDVGLVVVRREGGDGDVGGEGEAGRRGNSTSAGVMTDVAMSEQGELGQKRKCEAQSLDEVVKKKKRKKKKKGDAIDDIFG